MTIDIEKLKLLANNVRDYKSVVHQRVISILNDNDHDSYVLYVGVEFTYANTHATIPYADNNAFYCIRCGNLHMTIKWLFDYLPDLSNDRVSHYKETYEFELNDESALKRLCIDRDIDKQGERRQ